MGARNSLEADTEDNFEFKSGVFGGTTIPRTVLNAGFSIDSIVQGNVRDKTVRADVVQSLGGISVGLGGVVIGGVTGGISWNNGDVLNSQVKLNK